MEQFNQPRDQPEVESSSFSVALRRTTEGNQFNYAVFLAQYGPLAKIPML
jgi:hypothetical protein